MAKGNQALRCKVRIKLKAASPFRCCSQAVGRRIGQGILNGKQDCSGRILIGMVEWSGCVNKRSLVGQEKCTSTSNN